jgi:hypothetical protein
MKLLYDAAASALDRGNGVLEDFAHWIALGLVMCLAHYAPQWIFNSYGHRTLKARLPVRSALVKQCIARLVLWWVTTWESLVL